MAKARRNEPIHFHNSIMLPDNLIAAYNQKAITQEALILDLFTIAAPDLTLYDVRSILNQSNIRMAPSSVPRALSNLCRDGKLILTEEKRDGEWGVPNGIYRIKKN